MHQDDAKNAKPTIYVTRDIERALGRAPSEDYRVVSNRAPYSRSVERQYHDFVILIDGDPGILSTKDLLSHSDFAKLMAETPGDIMVFKNTPQIEAVARENCWNLLNPPAALAEKIENKISQVGWLGALGQKYLPETDIAKASGIEWKNRRMVIQWAHGHTGKNTLLVNSEKELHDLSARFPERLARITPFLKGPSFTVNAVAGNGKVLVGNLSYQITGLPPFTDNRFSTVGNDWSVAHSLLSKGEKEFVAAMAREIGEKMLADGWRGLFGIDTVKDEELDKIFLIEINARQPASTTFESLLQQEKRKSGAGGMTVFEAHLKALSDEPLDQTLIEISDGAQIVQRRTKKTASVSEDIAGSLRLAGYKAIPYSNAEENSDLLRVQSPRGIMESHGKLNAIGREIADIISK